VGHYFFYFWFVMVFIQLSCFHEKAPSFPSSLGSIRKGPLKGNKYHPTFLMRGFFLFLSHSPHIPMPSPLATTGVLGRPVAYRQLAGSMRVQKVIALSFLWGQ
jgi:hypothetical protein